MTLDLEPTARPEQQFGPLAAALAKAQASFPEITRSKEVTVSSERTGRSYKFKYAPLDSIFAAVRQPLADNGLAVAQLLDGDELVTMLLHESGAFLEARTPLPRGDASAQALGSAITYMRRYSLQALLGIAAEEDDDGNRADGNGATFTERGRPDAGGAVEELLGMESVQGNVKLGSSEAYKLEPRETPDGMAFGFRLEMAGDKAIPQVVVMGEAAIAALLATQNDPKALLNQWVRVKGRLYAVRSPGKRTFNRLKATEIETREWSYPLDPSPQEAAGEGSIESQAAEATPMSADAEAPVAGAAVPVAAPASICGNKGSMDTVCNLLRGHEGKHKELATDGRVLASW